MWLIPPLRQGIIGSIVEGQGPGGESDSNEGERSVNLSVRLRRCSPVGLAPCECLLGRAALIIALSIESFR